MHDNLLQDIRGYFLLGIDFGCLQILTGAIFSVTSVTGEFIGGLIYWYSLILQWCCQPPNPIMHCHTYGVDTKRHDLGFVKFKEWKRHTCSSIFSHYLRPVDKCVQRGYAEGFPDLIGQPSTVYVVLLSLVFLYCSTSRCMVKRCSLVDPRLAWLARFRLNVNFSFVVARGCSK